MAQAIEIASLIFAFGIAIGIVCLAFVNVGDDK